MTYCTISDFITAIQWQPLEWGVTATEVIRENYWSDVFIDVEWGATSRATVQIGSTTSTVDMTPEQRKAHSKMFESAPLCLASVRSCVHQHLDKCWHITFTANAQCWFSLQCSQPQWSQHSTTIISCPAEGCGIHIWDSKWYVGEGWAVPQFILCQLQEVTAKQWWLHRSHLMLDILYAALQTASTPVTMDVYSGRVRKYVHILWL